MTNIYQPHMGDLHEYIRVHSDMFLPSGGLTISKKLAQLLVVDALALGVKELIVRASGNWMVVVGDRDWLRIGKFLPSDLVELFHQMHPFPEAGVNSVRHETVVYAFASEIVTGVDFEAQAIKGSVPPREEFEPQIGVDRISHRWIAFKAPEDLI